MKNFPFINKHISFPFFLIFGRLRFFRPFTQTDLFIDIFYHNLRFNSGTALFVIPAMTWPCHRQSGNPLSLYLIWIPACAGITVLIGQFELFNDV
jgi:hypothetical protein